MFEKLGYIDKRYGEMEQQLGDPALYNDPQATAKLLKEQKEIQELVFTYRAYRQALQTAADAQEMMTGELREMAQEEYEKAKADIQRLEEELRVMLLPRDPKDERNVIVEIRGGAGGEEAALFAGVLYRMYGMYADSRRWKTEVLNVNETELGGIKEISFMIEGKGAYSRLKFESGVHRVQRVPETEASGRIHTSTVTVAVLAEAEEVDIDINSADLQVDTYRSSGAGGQHVNKTESAIRITHVPTGVVVECQEERSQHKNRDRAMKILRSRLLEAKQQEQDKKIAAERRSQVGTGDRSERIRTYNYPQGRCTDHRIGYTSHQLDNILNGALDELLEALNTADQAEKLRSAGDAE